MSSTDVRTIVKNEMDAFSAANNIAWFDLSDYNDNSDLPSSLSEPFLLVQYVGGMDNIATLATDGIGWIESGLIMIHIVVPTGFKAKIALDIASNIIPIFEMRRFGQVVFEEFDAFTDQVGSAIRVDGAWHGWTGAIAYYRNHF